MAPEPSAERQKPAHEGRWRDYGMALVFSLVAWVFTWFLNLFFDEPLHYALFYISVLALGLLARPGAVIFSIILGVLGCGLILSHQGLGAGWGDDVMHLLVFVLFGCVAILLGGYVHKRHKEVAEAERFRSLALVAADLGTFDWDPRSDILKLDERARAHMGLSQNQTTLHQCLTGIIHPHDRETVEAAAARSLRTEEVVNLQHRVIWSDGGVHWISVCGQAFFSPADPLATRVVGTISNIDCRKAKEAELEEEARLAHLRADVTQGLQTAADACILLQHTAVLLVERLEAAFARIWKLDQGGEWLELQASAGLYTHLNGSHARIRIGELKVGRIAKERRPHTTNKVMGDPNIPEQEWARREGLVSFAGFPLISEDRVLGVMVLFSRHPLSDAAVATLRFVAGATAQAIGRLGAEEALARAKNDLARINADLEVLVHERTAELEAFCYSLSHDMRAPLRAIQSFAAILQAERGNVIGPLGNRYLDMMIAAAERLDKLIRDVLAFSRLSREKIVEKPLDPEAIVRELLRERSEFRNADIQIASPLPRLLGDESSMYQCLANIFDNAVKFVRPGETPRVRVWAEQHRRQPGEVPKTRLCIEDNGIGIDPEVQSKIFNLFERYHDRPEYGGSGIGLAIVQRAAARMHAKVGVDSVPGKGSLFWLEMAEAA